MAWTDQVVANSAKLAARLEGPEGRTELDNHPMHPRGAGRVPPDVSAALVEDFGHHDPVGVAMQMRYTLPTASVRSLAPENKCPALLTIGSSETAFVETAEHVREVMPHLESVELDAGHNVNLHAIDAWNEAVARFFASHHPSS